jgi:hypothetical protein
MWVRVPATTASQQISMARTSGLLISMSATSGDLGFFRVRATTNLHVRATQASWPSVTAGAWIFMCGIYDTDDVNACRLFIGTEVLWAREPSTYGTKQAGVGTIGADTGTTRIGVHPAGVQPWGDRIATFSWWLDLLTPAQIWELQATGRVQGLRSLLNARYTATAGIDWAYQRNATLTGTLTDNTGPLVQLPWGYQRFDDIDAPAAAAAGRIFKLAGRGGGLVGPSIGLAG